MNRVRDSLDMLHNCPRNCIIWLCLYTPHSISSQYLSSDIAAISKRSTWIVFNFHCICQTGVTLSMQTWFDRFDCNGTILMLCKLQLTLSQYYLKHLWVCYRYQNNCRIQNYLITMPRTSPSGSNWWWIYDYISQHVHVLWEISYCQVTTRRICIWKNTSK